MQVDTALIVGVLFGSAVYLILQTSFVRILFGFTLLTHAANVLVLSMSGSPDGKNSPIADGSGNVSVDPLPQALILTAIVIGFGLSAYLILLLYRMFLDGKTTNAEELFDQRKEENAP